ncbi:MAG: AsmA-like C-terminal region-containing protein, partial [Woeseiaceae bacterium]|nr:AsmA-like C-terminal region-containing protein [Woeseiaceae bacterium]
RYFSDEPLDTSWLQLANLDLEISVGHLVADAINVTDVDIGIELQDAALKVEPIYMRDSSGSVDAGFRLGPTGDVYTMEARVAIDNVHIGVLVSEDADISTLPLFSGEMEIAGSGTSIRSILGASDGHARLQQGPGRIKELFGPFLFRDLISQVIGALNIRRERGFLNIECGFYDGTIEDGVLAVDRVAVQTDRITLIASGKIRLRSERLDITFRIKPREGIGVSLGGLVTSFIGVGGTLADPSISLDPGRSAATTGAAFATGGLSLLARGLWDRVSAEASICKDLEKKTTSPATPPG